MPPEHHALTAFSLLHLAPPSPAGLLHAPDPMFVLVMLLQNCVPTALNVHTLATLHANREAASAALLFWQYLAALVALPAWLALFLGLAQAYFV